MAKKNPDSFFTTILRKNAQLMKFLRKNTINEISEKKTTINESVRGSAKWMIIDYIRRRKHPIRSHKTVKPNQNSQQCQSN